jgi:hypothetical protein
MKFKDFMGTLGVLWKNFNGGFSGRNSALYAICVRKRKLKQSVIYTKSFRF